MRYRAFVPRVLVVTVVAALLATASVGADEAAPTDDPFAPFEPFVGRTWKALVNPERQLWDVARWERALADTAVRIVHSVGDGQYGGETLVVWDAERETLAYFYFTTAGFFTRGTMRFEEGRLSSREVVTGGGGVSEVEATQEVLPDGRLRVVTRMLRDGVWEDRGEVLYSEAPEARLVLPDPTLGSRE